MDQNSPFIYVPFFWGDTSSTFNQIFSRHVKPWRTGDTGMAGFTVGDGGKSVALPSGRSFWIFGDPIVYDSFGNARMVIGSIAGITPTQILDSNAPAPRFWGRKPFFKRAWVTDPTVVQLLEVTTASDVYNLNHQTTKFQGGWEWYGGEDQDPAQGGIWIFGTLSRGSELYHLAVGMRPYGWTHGDGTQWLYKIEGTDRDIASWTHHEQVLLTDKFSSPVWEFMFDDVESSGYIYVFGLDRSIGPEGDLKVARCRPENLPDYSQWWFLSGPFADTTANYEWVHPSPIGVNVGWRPTDDSLTYSIATDVGIEFSMDRITHNGVTRWLLVHALNTDFSAGIGVLRISGGDDLMSIPNDPSLCYAIKLGNVVNGQSVDADLTDPSKSIDGYTTTGWIFRGFSLHRDLSGFPTAGSAGFDPYEGGGGRRIILGYTLFGGGQGPGQPITGQWNCGDLAGGKYCGARRFGSIDLDTIWPATQLTQPGAAGQARQGVSSSTPTGSATVPALHAVPKRAKPAEVLPNLAAYLTAAETTTLRELASLSVAQLTDLAQHALSYATPGGARGSPRHDLEGLEPAHRDDLDVSSRVTVAVAEHGALT